MNTKSSAQPSGRASRPTFVRFKLFVHPTPLCPISTKIYQNIAINLHLATGGILQKFLTFCEKSCIIVVARFLHLCWRLVYLQRKDRLQKHHGCLKIYARALSVVRVVKHKACPIQYNMSWCSHLAVFIRTKSIRKPDDLRPETVAAYDTCRVQDTLCGSCG